MTIEIIGLGCVAPGSGSSVELFENLRNSVCSISEIPSTRWAKARFWHPKQGVLGKTYTFAAGIVSGVEEFDPVVFGLSKREASAMDPQQRILLAVTWRALEDAALTLSALQSQSVGVYVGASSLDSANLSAEDPASGGPYFMTGNTLSIVANRLSHILGLNGPSLTIDTACSSSLVALDQAVEALERREIDTAIVGGVNLLNHPLPYVGFAQARMLSPEGRCRAYDNEASGYVRSEGAVTVILRRTQDVRTEGDRSRARILASGVNSAGRTNGISLPSAEAQLELLRRIYQEAEIDPESIAFIEGHGTGTKVGDPAEVWAIGHAIGMRRTNPIKIGSIKTNIGHTEPASGLFGLVKAVMALENNYLPGSLFFETPNQTIDFQGLNVSVASVGSTLPETLAPRVAAVNSFGFGGTNAHVVLSDPERVRQLPPANTNDQYFFASAHTKSALTKLIVDYSSQLAGMETTKADELVSASYAGRSPMRHRAVVHAAQGHLVAEQLKIFLDGKVAQQLEIGEAPAAECKIAFVFGGNGSQWVGMGLDAYRHNEIFGRHFNLVSQQFEPLIGENLVELLSDESLVVRLSDTRIAQPLIFTVQVALAKSMQAAGIQPECVIGHSIGEVAAAHVAGALPLKDAISIVAARSKTQHKSQGLGTMAAALCSEDVAKALLHENEIHDVVIAAVNAQNSVTLSGSREGIAKVSEIGQKQKIAVKYLDIDYPFHHPFLDVVEKEFLAALPEIKPVECAIGFVSTVTGTWLSGADLSAAYWWRNAREPVAFHNAVLAALDIGCNLFIEISPRSILGSYVKDAVRERSANAQVLPTLMREKGNDIDPVQRSISKAFAYGAAGITGIRRASVNLPILPFEPELLTVEPTTDRYDLFGRNSGVYGLAGWRVDPNGTAWKNHIDAALFPDLAEHVVEGRAILPGAGFVEIALQVACEYLEVSKVSLTNMELLSPLALDAKLLELSTIISPETGVIEIRSRERLSSDEWTLHAVARCHRLQADKPKPMIESSGEKLQIVGHDEIYRVASAFGLDYGKGFRLLEKTVVHGTSHIECVIACSLEPAHPFIKWQINPMELDAAFHGLVGLFDKLTGSLDGAPYIPVRFGSIELHAPGARIRRAIIDILKFSEHSIKARFILEDDAGNMVLSMEDCRFRRTSLRRHVPLGALGLHYESIPWSASRLATLRATSSLLDMLGNDQLDDSSLFLNAAVYRACYDIILRLVKADGFVGDLPGEASLNAFLFGCLLALEGSELAQEIGGQWKLKPDINLPSLEALLSELQADRPDRGVEAIMIATISANAQKQLVELQNGGAPTFSGPSKATLDHFRLHSAQVQAQNRQMLQVLNTLISENPGVAINALQIGASATSICKQVSDLIAPGGGHLTVFEPNEDALRPLEVAFETSNRVVASSKLTDAAAFNLIFSTSDLCHRILESDSSAMSAIASSIRDGARLLVTQRAASPAMDFLFGYSCDPSATEIVAGMPIGVCATEGDWQRLAARLGLERSKIRTKIGEYGPLIVIDGQNSPMEIVRKPFESHLFLVGNEIPGLETTVGISLDLDKKAIESKLRDALTSEPEQGTLTFIYSPSNPTPDTDLAIASWKLTLFATTLNSVLEELASPQSAVFVLLLPGGAPVVNEAYARSVSPFNSAIWSLARVFANEFPNLEIHHVDAEIADWKSALEVCLSGDKNREWIVSGKGTKVSALRIVGEPFATGVSQSYYYESATIRQRTAARVDSLHWRDRPLPLIQPHEALIEVAATGLNFRDVMWSMGLLPEEAIEDGFAGTTIGMEFSGKVIAIGSMINDLNVGDNVMGIGPAAFSTHAVVARAGLAKVPETVDLQSAATIPVVFLTAWYALKVLGRAIEGETVLIHGAAGGVGLAAIQVSRHLGLKVIATVGNQEKRDYLNSLGVEHIFDSRSLSFVSDVQDVTCGEGVNLVLNSLFAESMEASIGLLKPFGRFLELGKRDYFADRKIGLRPFRRNISYFGIDADQLPLQAPHITEQIFRDLGELFAAGELVALPYRAFAYDEIAAAFHLMQNAGHIGKIIVTPPRIAENAVERTPINIKAIEDDGCHIVVGGIGGFGLASADWLVSRGARRIALVTRRGKPDVETLEAINRWKSRGVKTSLHACDVINEKSVYDLLQTLRMAGPISGVIHAAMVLDDGLMQNLSEARFTSVVDVKAKGADNLHKATREDKLDYFLLFSSATTLVGNPGQANYVTANGFLEGLARKRRSEGLPALAVAFGAISDRGYLAANTEINETLSRRLGTTSLTAQKALSFVEHYMAMDPGSPDCAVVVCANIDWSAAISLPTVSSPLFEVPLRRTGTREKAGTNSIDLLDLVANKSEFEAQDIIYRILAAEMAAVLHVAVDTLPRDKVLKEAGLDSLMAVELSMSFKERMGIDIPLNGIGDTTTVDQIVRKLFEKLTRSGDDRMNDNSTSAEIESLTSQHINASVRAAE